MVHQVLGIRYWVLGVGCSLNASPESAAREGDRTKNRYLMDRFAFDLPMNDGGVKPHAFQAQGRKRTPPYERRLTARIVVARRKGSSSRRQAKPLLGISRCEMVYYR